MSLRTILSKYGFAFQRELFPALEEELGPLGERYELFGTVLGFVQVEPFLTGLRGLPGRPQADRAALARAFIAKACPVLDTGAVFAITTTRALIELPGHRPVATPSVRLEPERGGPQRGDVLACLQRLRRQRLAQPLA